MIVNILLVDDHELILDGLQDLISYCEYHKVVGTAINGNLAKDFILNHKEIDLVITDISMPECNGIELCKWIKNNHPNIKVLMLTMFDTDAVIYSALEAKADGFLLKNTNRKTLCNGIERIMEGASYFDNKIINLVRDFNATSHSHQAKSILTTREIEILKYVLEEKSSKEIADLLFISKRTVENHRMNIMEKLNIHSTIGLVKYAISTGIL